MGPRSRCLHALAAASFLLLGLPSVGYSAHGHSGPAPRPGVQLMAPRSSGDKDGFGTAYTYGARSRIKPSRVWFTVLNGSLTETYYPTLASTAINRLLFLVADGKRHTADETRNFHQSVGFLASRTPAYRITATDRRDRIKITKDLITDPSRDALLMHVQLNAPRGMKLYAHLEPALDNSSLGNRITVSGGAVEAWTKDAAVALVTTGGWGSRTAAYRASNDGLQQLERSHRLLTSYTSAGVGRVDATVELRSHALTLALGFGRTPGAALAAALASLRAGFSRTLRAYIAGWRHYTAGLHSLGKHTDPWFYQAAIAIKSAEDKTYSGAIVASPTHPFGQLMADDPENHGYVKVWPRDLYHSAMGLLAAGDGKTPNEALDFLAHVQGADGGFPQNIYVQDRAADTGVQLDEDADPILLAWRLGRQDLYATMVKRAADYIVANGPATPQERWEESGGYSPSTIAAEIAGLVAAADMAGKAHDSTSQSKFLSTADNWERRVESWTYTTNGPFDAHHYYLRLSQGDPNAPTPLNLANGGGTYDQRTIVDAGFLELVRLGILLPRDPHVISSLPVIDAKLESRTALGPVWHRYNHDGYDYADNKGHPWPVLSGERAMYDLIAGDRPGARRILTSLQRFAGTVGLLPEQVYEKSGLPTTSARPLIWAEGEYLVLDRSLADGKPFDQPSVVAARYR